MLKQEEFESIILWVQEKINGEKYEISWGIGDSVSGINQNTINNLPKLLDYTSYVESKGKKKVKKMNTNAYSIEFEKFWDVYPGISRFEYKGKKFPGERVLKANKQVCMRLYSEIICTTHYTHENILKALQVQLENIKIESYKTGQNRMQYLKSAEVYLRQKAYESWIGEVMPNEPLTTSEKMADYTFNA